MFLSSEHVISVMLTCLLLNFNSVDVYDINLLKKDIFKCKSNIICLNRSWGEIINYEQRKSLPNSI